MRCYDTNQSRRVLPLANYRLSSDAGIVRILIFPLAVLLVSGTQKHYHNGFIRYRRGGFAAIVPDWVTLCKPL
jgi:hypothetical protein